MTTSTSSLTSSNRVNIPAVCRICNPHSNETLGTGVLVGPGLLLTSIAAVGSHVRAGSLAASFFEGTKKRPVLAKLLPTQYYFAAAYPDHMDYCLIACEEQPIFNVSPVHVPLIRKEWLNVEEGDVVLVVQHAIGPVKEDGEDSGAAALEQKRFEEVLRCRNDLIYLKPNGATRTAGCPTFNERGQLVGLQSQFRADGEGIVNHVLSIVSVVKHLFANAQLSRLPQEQLSFEDVWGTWFIDKDVSRAVSIMGNFKGKEMVRHATRRLCELTATPHLAGSVEVCGGIGVILANVQHFPDDAELTTMGLRALWNISVGNEDCLAQVVQGDGVGVMLRAMEAFPDVEPILEFGTVMLYNISTSRSCPDLSGELGARALCVVYAAAKRFIGTTVLQKFSLSLFTQLMRVNGAFATVLADDGAMPHVARLIEDKHRQVFLMEVLMQFVGEMVQHRRAVELVRSGIQLDYPIAHVIHLLLSIMLEYKEHDVILVEGNRALWGLGNDPECRALILQNPNSNEAFRLSLPALLASTRR